MPYDKVVDSTQLNADLTSVANAIRTKGGTSGSLAFPSGFVNAIGDIPTGGGGDSVIIQGVYIAALCHVAGMPVKYVIDSPALAQIDFGYSNAPTTNTDIEEIMVASSTKASSTGVSIPASGMRMALKTPYKLKKVDLQFIPLQAFYQAFNVVYGGQYVPDLETVIGLNFSLCGGANYRVGQTFLQCTQLKHVTLKPNCLGQLDLIGQNYNWLTFQNSPLLTDASLISIANGLCATYTSKLVLHNTSKARCQEIAGIVSQVTDDTGTYDSFAADAGGTVTLSDFITQTKGWTIA